MKSMTGFGSGEYCTHGMVVSVDIRSLNRKHMDIHIHMPKELHFLEKNIRKTIHDHLVRGTINIRIELSGQLEGEHTTMLDLAVAKNIHAQLSTLQQTLKLPESISVQDILSIGSAKLFVKQEVPQNLLHTATEDALTKALQELLAEKSREGTAILQDLQKRQQKLKEYLQEITSRAPEVTLHYHQKLTERIKQYIEDIDSVDDRIRKEIALFTDRSDITEEITRLTVHLDSMAEIWQCDKPVGRKLDFLIQEIFREINTIGSKCNDLDIAVSVIDFKTELERIREQVQNIE